MISPESPPQEARLLPRKLRNARALWVVLIIMALLAGCALLFARGSMRLSGDWQSQLSNTLTVQIMLENAEDWTEQTNLARSALATALPGVDIDVLVTRHCEPPGWYWSWDLNAHSNCKSVCKYLRNTRSYDGAKGNYPRFSPSRRER